MDFKFTKFALAKILNILFAATMDPILAKGRIMEWVFIMKTDLTK